MIHNYIINDAVHCYGHDYNTNASMDQDNGPSSASLFYFFKWANPGLFFFIFVIFSIQFQYYKLKKA